MLSLEKSGAFCRKIEKRQIMDYKALLMDEAQMMRSLARITHEIIEKNRGCENLMLMGVKRRGIHLAHILCENIKKFEGTEVPVGYVDIAGYRDDNDSRAPDKADCLFPESVTDKTVIIVDDVISTGRTTRAAIEAVFANGRPRAIQLAVLIDRGHRELPIKADYVGKNVPTSLSEVIAVKFSKVDGVTNVGLYEI